ncbi:DNA-processing protein DprA [Paenibacillus chungangensis]|uniref:DNA-processing protein DprA n=1 Tax=Paenibacillus chungangensis TaxID=696535 RepID=A0ABW3HPR7_9BACL
MDTWQQQEKEMVLAFHEIPGIGWHAIKKAVKHQLWRKESWTRDDLLNIGLRPSQAQKAVDYFREHAWRCTTSGSVKMKHCGASILTPYDAQYPALLKECPQPPWVLYAMGRLELLTRPAVAIVGTRVPTAYGSHVATRMARELSAAGVTIVSGLARGVDSRAHEAALEERGGTIAVLPTPIDDCYPPQNQSLYRRIAERGLLLSENPLGSGLHPGQFHQRNRVIAGLSRATIVVEGASRSGSLITASHARDMDRELFAVPGPINSPKSEGPNELIANGMAILMHSAEQVFQELLWLRGMVEACDRVDEQHDSVASVAKEAEPTTSEERKVLALLCERPMSLDELQELTAFPFGHLSSILLNLCIKRRIEQQTGSLYMVL